MNLSKANDPNHLQPPKKTILALSPHPDDVEFGAGGFLLQELANGSTVDIVYCLQEKENQVQECATKYGYNYLWLTRTTVKHTRPEHNREFVYALDNILKYNKYTHLLIPHSGDRHQDHKIVNALAVSSARRFHGCVLQYEVCVYTNDNTQFRPNIYVGIDDVIEQKLEWANTYLDVNQSMLDCCRGLNMLRGNNTTNKHAEAFELLKWTW